MSCTNVMLQCLDVESRCIYVLGTMFKLDSKIAGDILEISPEAYRQKLSRIRKKMADFLKSYCGLAGGICSCQKRVGYAISSHRLDPLHLEYSELQQLDETVLLDFKESMENLDTLSIVFTQIPKYRASQNIKDFVLHILQSGDIQTVCQY